MDGFDGFNDFDGLADLDCFDGSIGFKAFRTDVFFRSELLIFMVLTILKV